MYPIDSELKSVSLCKFCFINFLPPKRQNPWIRRFYLQNGFFQGLQDFSAYGSKIWKFIKIHNTRVLSKIPVHVLIGSVYPTSSLYNIWGEFDDVEILKTSEFRISFLNCQREKQKKFISLKQSWLIDWAIMPINQPCFKEMNFFAVVLTIPCNNSVNLGAEIACEIGKIVKI